MKATLESLRGKGLLGPLDEHTARTVCRIAGDVRPEVLLAAALAVRQVGLGHVCASLPALVRQRQIVADDGVTPQEVEWPDADRWIGTLRESPLVATPRHAERRPLVLDDAGRLYLRRYFEHEERLAASLRQRAAMCDTELDEAALEDALARLFARSAEAAPTAEAARDEQRDAARTAVTRRLCIISGGPGPGKTSTVVKILALLVEQRERAGLPTPRVLLLAPTGKAATRLTEAIQRAKSGLDCSASVRAAIPDDASTIHRALGSVGGSGTRFRHDAGHPLRADVVLVDEASMVDLALMSRLADAVPREARLILLGDKDQLASVEAGAVLGELCAGATDAPAGADAPLAASVVHLTRSWRYGPGSGIEALAVAINAGDTARALDILGQVEIMHAACCSCLGNAPRQVEGCSTQHGELSGQHLFERALCTDIELHRQHRVGKLHRRQLIGRTVDNCNLIRARPGQEFCDCGADLTRTDDDDFFHNNPQALLILGPRNHFALQNTVCDSTDRLPILYEMIR